MCDNFAKLEARRSFKYLVEKGAPRLVDESALLGVRRNLFGPPDQQDLLNLRSDFQSHVQNASAKYNYDFKAGRPEKTSDWDWHSLSVAATQTKCDSKITKTIKRKKTLKSWSPSISSYFAVKRSTTIIKKVDSSCQTSVEERQQTAE